MSRDEIIKYLSDKYKLPKYTIKQIVDSPLKVLCDSLNKREMKGFIIPRLGKFIILPKRAKWIEENILKEALERDKQIEENKKIKKNVKNRGDTTGVQESVI